MVILKDTPFEVPQLRRYMAPPELPAEAQQSLEGHLPTIVSTLSALLVSTGMAWVVSCKKLGGTLYIVMKLLSMLSWTIFSYGAVIAYLGWYMATDDFSSDFNPQASKLYTAIAIVGLFLMLVAIVGILGMRVYYKIRIVGQMLLRIFCITLSVILLADVALCCFIGWYISQLDRRVDQDWDKYQVYRNSTEYAQLTGLSETTRNLTKDGFVELVKVAYKFLALAAAVVFLILLGAVLASGFIARTNNPTPGRAESMFKTVGGLIPGGGDSDSDDGVGGGCCCCCGCVPI